MHTYLLICVFNFRGWCQPQNYVNSEIFPIYGIVLEIILIADASINVENCFTLHYGFAVQYVYSR